jgi:GNAT superfamily N-acetyltransferase
MKMPFSKGYPAQYESRLRLKDGGEVFLRPVMQTDGDLLVDLFNKLSVKSIRLRFLRLLPSLPEDMLFEFTHVNYDTEFALVAVIPEYGLPIGGPQEKLIGGHKDAIIAVARYAFDPKINATDFAVAVRDDWQNKGLGKSLLGKLFAIGREHGISRFVSVISPQNNIIRQTLAGLGYEIKYSRQSGVFQVEVLV